MGLGGGRCARTDYRIHDSPDEQSRRATGGTAQGNEARRHPESDAAESTGDEPHGGDGDDLAGFRAAETHAQGYQDADGARLPAPAHGRGDHRGSDALDAFRANTAVVDRAEVREAGQRGDLPS